ncbi:hypothetical protein FAM8407_02238 [Lacticaseibacillus paracasei]|nr:hypothetical protein FAM18099_01828 [Lacticaseibacillus paracasei]RNE44665.1 hypothetical protein FAM8407_02238 [Lacticaseibacillus paracasei]TDG81992.1 hypothetical protein C5L26_002806 [Lacticaseibacillus paracasei subsp. paracasei]
MSQYDPTLSVLGIPDHNIKVALFVMNIAATGYVAASIM